MHPSNYDGAVFEMLSGTDSFAFRQNTIHGGQPIAILNSSTQSCNFFGDCSILMCYNKSSIDNLISNIYNDGYIKPKLDSLIANINSSKYYNKAEINDTDTDLSTLFLNTYTTHEVYTL